MTVEGERGGEQSSSVAASSFRFRDVLEAEDASCLRGCCVDDVLRGQKRCVGGCACMPDALTARPTNLRFSKLQLLLLNGCLWDVG